MVIEAAKGGHTQVVKLLLEWPNRYAVAQDQVSQVNVVDAPIEEVMYLQKSIFHIKLLGFYSFQCP